MNNSDADHHVRDVYAHFGLALYLAQVLEHGLANALVFAQLLPQRAGRPIPRAQFVAEFDAFLGKQFEQTLGKLIGGLRKATAVPPDLESLLRSALQQRNFLSHHFFRDRAQVFMSRSGRNQMIEELKRAQQLFEAADSKLTEVATPLRERYGLSDERLQPFMEEYFANIENDL
ncbi:MAG: hypothetical protein ACREXX_06170 [Gammaproteobacteria bacterium]